MVRTVAAIPIHLHFDSKEYYCLAEIKLITNALRLVEEKFMIYQKIG